MTNYTDPKYKCVACGGTFPLNVAHDCNKQNKRCKTEFHLAELQLLRGLLHSELLDTPDKLIYEEWRNLIKGSIEKVDKLEDELRGE